MSEVLKTVYSPAGEKFEMSPPNARDVIRNAGWTENKPHPDDVAKYLASQGSPDLAAGDESEVPAAEEPAAEQAEEQTDDNADDNSDENSDGNSDDDDNANENTDENADGSDDNSDDSDADAEKAVKTEPNHFADMDRDAVRAYIDETFPGTEIDGRWNRDRLVALSLELAAKRNA